MALRLGRRITRVRITHLGHCRFIGLYGTRHTKPWYWIPHSAMLRPLTKFTLIPDYPAGANFRVAGSNPTTLTDGIESKMHFISPYHKGIRLETIFILSKLSFNT